MHEIVVKWNKLACFITTDERPLHLYDRWCGESVVMDDVTVTACTSERGADNSTVLTAVSLHQSVAVQPTHCTQLNSVYARDRPATDTSTAARRVMGGETRTGVGRRVPPGSHSAGLIHCMSVCACLTGGQRLLTKGLIVGGGGFFMEWTM